MDENPYSPPQSDLETSVQPENGLLMPWEDRGNHPQLWDRIVQTLKTLLQPSKAGKILGGGGRILPSISFMAFVGVPLPWLFMLLVALFGPINPMQSIFKHFGVPMVEPEPAMQAAQRFLQFVQLVLFPIFMAIGFGIWGLLIHGGLWLTRGLQPGRGLETTFRTLLYSSAIMLLVGWVFNLWMFLPPLAALVLLALSVLVWIGFWVYQGVLLAKAHETQVWRGILGFFAPWLLFLCCCGGLGAFLGVMVALASRR